MVDTTLVLAKRRGTNQSYPLNVDGLENLFITAVALPLPAGAATAANQLVMIASLQLIDDLRNALVSVGLDALLVQQAIHDLLNCNANLQVGDVDVAQANPVPSRGTAAIPVIYNINMIVANTEYAQALPANTQQFCLRCHGEEDVRYAFVPGQVAAPVRPYGLVPGGMQYYEQTVWVNQTLYVACPVGGQFAEIIAWT